MNWVTIILCSMFFAQFIFSARYLYNKHLLLNREENEEKEDIDISYFISDEDPTSCGKKAYKCESKNCDCAKVCKSDNYALMEIYEDSEVIYKKQSLEPGFYCLPKIESGCKPHVSALIYTGNHWACLCKYPDVFSGKNCATLVACLMPYQSTKNTLWDHKLDERTDLGENNNYYEVLSNGKLRFRCKCEKDDKSNDSVVFEDLPFNCFVDKCKGNIPRSSVKGFDDELMACNCGDYNITRQKNRITNDSTSPCTTCYNSKVNEHLKINGLCYNMNSHIFDKEFNFYPSVNYFNPISNCYSINLDLKVK